MKKRTNLEVLNIVSTALETDIPLQYVIEAIERQMLENARERHPSHKSAYKALKIPKSSYYDKRRYFFTPPNPV